MNRIFIVLSIFSFLFGCKGKNGDTGPSGPTGQTIKGDLSGTINLYDDNGKQNNSSGASVQLEGTSYIALTDSAGKWLLTNVPMGTYVLSFSKPGYATTKEMSYKFVGGSQTTNVGIKELYTLPTFYVSSLTKIDSISGINGIVYVSGILSSMPSSAGTGRVIIFAGLDSAVSAQPGKNINSTVTGVTSISFKQNFDVGAKSGTKVYFTAYGYRYGGYLDTTTNQFVYTGLSSMKSNVLSYIYP